MTRRLLSRLARLESRTPSEELRVRIRLGHLKRLPRDYTGARHVIVARELPPQNGQEWVETLTAMAYDSKHDQILMFGGAAIQPPQDTWTWDWGAPANIPKISAVVSASAFGGFSSVAPGSWVEIFGSSLATTTRGWSGSDFSGNNAPTSLDGVQVTIGGQKAFVDYIAVSPGQINAQLPSSISPGPSQLTVSNANGTSAPFNITVNATQPGLLAPGAFKIGGT